MRKVWPGYCLINQFFIVFIKITSKLVFLWSQVMRIYNDLRSAFWLFQEKTTTKQVTGKCERKYRLFVKVLKLMKPFIFAERGRPLGPFDHPFQCFGIQFSYSIHGHVVNVEVITEQCLRLFPEVEGVMHRFGKVGGIFGGKHETNTWHPVLVGTEGSWPCSITRSESKKHHK